MKALIAEGVSIGTSHRRQSKFDPHLLPLHDLQPNQMSVKVHPVPDIADDEILFKTAAVALNPTDWKRTCLLKRLAYLRIN